MCIFLQSRKNLWAQPEDWGGLPLYDPKDWKHPTEQVAVSEIMYWSLAHGITEQVAGYLLYNCIFALFLENCAVARDKKWCRRITGGSLSIVKAGDTKNQSCFPKAVPPLRYQLPAGAPQSITQLPRSWDLDDLQAYCINTQILHLMSPAYLGKRIPEDVYL